MSVNPYQPHVWVLPEDDANRQLANGFLQDRYLSFWKIRVLAQAGGWNRVLECFLSDHVRGMERHTNRFMVLLIDFDGKEDRLQYAKAQIPRRLRERVFVLGALTEPEALKRAIPASYESIGLALARDCREGTDTTWGHDLLRHNAGELDRLRERVRPILFPSN
jgi:hypothetical protein